MSTIDKTITVIKPKDKFSIEIKNKILDTHLLSNNENAKIPPAAELTSQHNYDLSSSSSSSIINSTKYSNSNNLTNLNKHLKIELALNKNFKIKNSEFQVINEVNLKSQQKYLTNEFIPKGNVQSFNINGNSKTLKSTQNIKNEKSTDEIPSLNQLSMNNLNINDNINLEINNNSNSNNILKNSNYTNDDTKNNINNDNTKIIENHSKVHSEDNLSKDYSSLNKDYSFNYEKQIISAESNKKYDYHHSKISTKVRKLTNNEKGNNVFDNSIVINNELNNKLHVIPPKDSSSTNIKNELNKIYVNKIIYKNTKLNTLSTFTTDDKNKESTAEDLVKASSFTQNSHSHINKKIHRKNHEENSSSSFREEYIDKYRDLTSNLPIQYSEGESDFDFSESLINNKKRKRCKSIFDIYYETRKRNLKHSPSSNHKDHKHHKEDSLSHNMLSKETENNILHNDKDNKKTISDQSFVNKKNRSNSNDTLSRYYYSSDEDKEKAQNKVENSKTNIYKSNKKLKTKKSKILNKYENDLSYYYHRRQPPRSCRTKNEPLSAKIYYSMYSSEDNISEIEELFADLDNRQNNLENKIDNNNNDVNNYGKEYMYSSDSKLRIKNKINKSNKTKKNLKYKNSLASLHSISEEAFTPEMKEASTSVTPNKNNKKSKIINNKSQEKEDGDNKLSHNHYRYSSVSSSFSQRDRDQNIIRKIQDKDMDIDDNIEENEKITKEILMSKYHPHKLKNQRLLDRTSNIKSDQTKNTLKIKSLKSSYYHFSDNDNINNKYYSLNEEEEEEDNDDDDDNYDELESNSEYTSGITTPSQKKKSLLLLESKKLHDNLTSTPSQIKIKSKKYSTHHRRTTTTTTDDSSLLYDDIDSNTEIDSSIEGKGRTHHYKRKSLTKINENVFDISNEDKEDDQLFDFNLLKTNGGKKKMNTLKKQKFNSINNNSNPYNTSNRHYHQFSSSSCSTPSSQNKKFIPKNDCYDSEVLSYNKDPLDTHIIFKSLSCTFDNNTMKLSKSQLMAQSNKRNKSNNKLSTPEKKIKVKMLDLEEKKVHHSYHHYDLFGKKLKSKINSSDNFFKTDSKKYKSKYKSRNEQKEKDQEMLFMDMEEKKEKEDEEEDDDDDDDDGNDEEYSNLESFEDEDIIEEDSEKERNKYKNKNKNQRINRRNNLEDDGDLMDKISVYESESTCTPSKSLKRRKIKSINQERRFKTMNPWNRNPYFTIGPIQNPTLFKRSQSSSNLNETTYDINTNNNDNKNSNGTNNNNTNDAIDMKKSQDQMKSSSFTEHKIVTREVIEQLNSLTVTEDEYDITPALNRHSNIYIKNELFSLLNDMTAKEGSDSNIDNYTTIYSNSHIDKVELVTPRIVEKNKNENENDAEISKNKEEEFAIHYLCPEYQSHSRSHSHSQFQSQLQLQLQPYSQSQTQTQLQSQSFIQSQPQSQPQDILPFLSVEDSTSSLSFMEDHEDSFIQNLENKSKIDDNISVLNDIKVTTNSNYLPTPMDSTMEDFSNSTSINPCTPIKIKSININSSSSSSIEDSISDDKIPISTLSCESTIDSNMTSEVCFSSFDDKNDYPYNYLFVETVKNKIYQTLKTVDLLRDELYQIKYNRLKYEEELIKKNIHPGFEIQQSSLKEELFNKIKQAKKLRDFSIESIYKSYQTNLNLINNTFIDNKHKLKYDLNRKISHNSFKLCKEIRSLKRKRIMDKKKINLYSLPSKKSILEAAKVLATFSTPVVFNENKNIGTGSHHHNTINKRGYNSSALPIFSNPSTSSSSIPATHSHTYSHRPLEHYYINSKNNIFQNKKKRIPINCNGLNSQELDHDLSLLKLLN